MPSTLQYIGNPKMSWKAPLVACQIALLALAAGCSRSHPATSVNEKPVGTRIETPAPLGLPPVPVPANNPQTAEAVALGRKLFYETKLSGDTSLPCGSCHNPQLGFSDGQRHSTGVGGKLGARNAPTVVNAAYAPIQ